MAEVPIEIKLILGQTLKALKNVEKNTQTLGSSFTKLSVLVTGVNQAFQLAGKIWGKISGAISDVTNAAAIQQKAMNDLRFAMQSAGEKGDEAANRFATFAGELQKVTKFGDETIMTAGALFTQLTKVTGEGLEQATIAAANLSSTIGIDLESAMRLIAKSTEDGGSGLRRYGITIEKGASQAENLANAVNAINNTMGGKAQAEMNTFLGLQTALGNAWGDVKEQIGFAIIENKTLIAVMQGLLSLMQQAPVILQAVATWLNNNSEALKAAAIAMGVAVTALTLYNIWLHKTTIATYALVTAKKALAIIMGIILSPVYLVTAAIIALGVAAFALVKYWDLVTAQMQRFVGYVIQNAVPVLKLMLYNTKLIVGLFNKDWADAIDNALLKMEEYGAALNEQGNQELEQIRINNEIKAQMEQEHQEEISAIKTDAQVVNLDSFKNANTTEAKLSKTWTETFKKELFTRKKFEAETDADRINNLKSTFGTIATLSDSNNKTLATIGKAAAISTATMDGIVAVQKALASAIFPFNFALAGIVGAATAANVAKIAGVKLAEGGIVMPRAGGVRATIAEAGKPEAVIPLDDERARRAMSGLGGNGININIHGDIIGEESFIDKLAEKLSDAVRYRNVELYASA